VGTVLGEAGVNIVSAAVGRRPEDGDEATMVITADAPVPQEVIAQIVERVGFLDGRAVTLGG
jgi:D-3-phosphoglycerate dehydrogenase